MACLLLEHGAGPDDLSDVRSPFKRQQYLLSSGYYLSMAPAPESVMCSIALLMSAISK